MTKDLFALLFENHSRFSQTEYTSKFLERLPLRFIEGAFLANPKLRTSDAFLEVNEAIASKPASTRHNPELYPHLNRLLMPDHPSLERHVRAIRIHLGLDMLAPSDGATSRFWRIAQRGASVFEIRDEQLQRIDDLVPTGAEDSRFPLVYQPYPQLFDDIDRSCYRGQPVCDPRGLRSSVSAALALIGAYSPEIEAAIRRTISVVAFMRRDRSGVKSFSMRNFYIGGIFVSDSHRFLLAEQLIHEYYHQCIWPWWLIESPSDLPSDDNQIKSPMTGRLRPVSVMVHAFLIYCSLMDFYRFALSRSSIDQCGEEELQDASAALARIETGVVPLFNALNAALIGRPKTGAIIETIADAVSLHRSPSVSAGCIQ